MSKSEKNALPPAKPTHEFADLGDGPNPVERLLSDSELDTLHRTAVGRPRMLWGSDTAFVRLSPEPDPYAYSGKRSDRGSDFRAIEIARALSEPLALRGPAKPHAIDELIATVFAAAPNFARPLEAIRQSALSMVRRGAPHFQFKPP